MRTRDIFYDKYPKKLQELISQTTGKFTSGIANYGLIYGDNKIAYHTNTACHAGLQIGRRWLKNFNMEAIDHIHRDEKLHYVWSSIRVYNNEWEDRHKAFIDYLVNRSIYHHAFVSKSADKIIHDRCLLLRTDVNNDYLAAACIASRALWEKVPVLNSWYNMVKDGVDERVAHMLAHAVSDKLNLSTFNGHCCFNGYYSVDDCKQMYKADELAFSDPLYCDSPRYDSIHKLKYRLKFNCIPWSQYGKGKSKEVYSFTDAVTTMFLKNSGTARSTTMKAIKEIEKEIINA